MRQGSEWTGRARKIVEDGVAARQSAGEISETLRGYGYSFSRNAVCGQANRMGLSFSKISKGNRKPNLVAWDATAEQILRDGIRDALTAAGISRKLIRAGYAFSRGAVASKASRLGLSFARLPCSGRLKGDDARPQPSGSGTSAKPVALRRVPQASRTGFRFSILSGDEQLATDAVAVAGLKTAEAQLRRDGGVRLEALGDRDCRGVIVGELGETLYCGQPVVVVGRLRSYCAACHARFCVPNTPAADRGIERAFNRFGGAG